MRLMATGSEPMLADEHAAPSGPLGGGDDGVPGTDQLAPA